MHASRRKHGARKHRPFAVLSRWHAPAQECANQNLSAKPPTRNRPCRPPQSRYPLRAHSLIQSHGIAGQHLLGGRQQIESHHTDIARQRETRSIIGKAAHNTVGETDDIELILLTGILILLEQGKSTEITTFAMSTMQALGKRQTITQTQIKALP